MKPVLVPCSFVTKETVHLFPYIGCGKNSGFFSNAKEDDSFIHYKNNIVIILTMNSSYISYSKVIVFKSPVEYINYVTSNTLSIPNMHVACAAKDNTFFVG
jgi:hypothetical protein